MIAHEFPAGAPRCIYCGTLATQHERTACPGPQGNPTKALSPLPPRRVAAIDDIDTIHARIIELRADGIEALNRAPAETEERT